MPFGSSRGTSRRSPPSTSASTSTAASLPFFSAGATSAAAAAAAAAAHATPTSTSTTTTAATLTTSTSAATSVPTARITNVTGSATALAPPDPASATAAADPATTSSNGGTVASIRNKKKNVSNVTNKKTRSLSRSQSQSRSSIPPSPSPSPSLPPSPSSSASSSCSMATPARRAQSTTMSPSSSTFLRSGFLSRLSLPLHLPLRSRPRTITDFYILCDEPHKKYNAADPVRGTVVLVVTKPLRLTHLVVTLHGSVRVLKDPAAVAKVQSISTMPRGGSSSRPRFHGNGLASLFQDEQVLSGEGRLEPGRYEFKFDLVFPEKGLPSSIDFERGSISYMVTATLTKPTQIAATVSCDRKITLTEKINVGQLPPPRPRTIFLEPLSKRTRKKKSSLSLEKGVVVGPETVDLASETDSLGRRSVTIAESLSTSLRESQAPSGLRRPAPPSDVQSEASADSARTTSSGPNPHDYRTLSQTDVGFDQETAYQQALNEKTITATIELLKGGCLPGDTVSVRVTVQHVKRVKSMTGVVVTLFRQGKIDYAPPASLFSGAISKEAARRLQRDDKYPRSRTGLSGLSLSSTGSISMFRKDLDQVTAPLIIDPSTLRASITVPVKIPDDSFPTIKGVPGDMISFKYHVEVIVDLGGKSSAQLHGRHSSSRLGHFSTSASDQSFNMFSSRRGAHIVETSELKRQHGVISISMESVVGTVDSSAARKYQASPSARTAEMAASDDDDIGLLPTLHPHPHHHHLHHPHSHPHHPHHHPPPHLPLHQHHLSPNPSYLNPQHPQPPPQPRAYLQPHQYQQHPYQPYHDSPPLLPNTRSKGPLTHEPSSHLYACPPPPAHYSVQHSPSNRFSSAPAPRPYASQVPGSDGVPPLPFSGRPAPEYIAPPQLPDPQNMSEKDRLRQAEARLLPSQPPGGPAPDREDADAADDDDDIYESHEPSRRIHAAEDAAEPSAPPDEDLVAAAEGAREASGSSPRQAASCATDDKQERERRRLLEEASAPPEFPEDMERRAGASGSAPGRDNNPSASAEPSAPVLNDDDDDHDELSHYRSIPGPSGGPSSGPSHAHHGEQLPAYER